MPKLSDIRRIIPEDFEEEYQDLVTKISGSYNEFADEIYQVVNGQLDFDNLSRSKVIVDVTFNSSGIPTQEVVINSKLSYVSMLHIGKITASNSNVKFTQAPYISWTYKGDGNVKIDYGIGFTAGLKYSISLELVS